MDVKGDKVVCVHTNRGDIYPRAVVNCAGVYSDVIADMAGDRTFTIHPRKGTDIILDKKKVGYALSSYARSYFAPLPKEAQPDKQEEVGHTKGGGVMRTIDGNILVGSRRSRSAVERGLFDEHKRHRQYHQKAKTRPTYAQQGRYYNLFFGYARGDL